MTHDETISIKSRVQETNMLCCMHSIPMSTGDPLQAMLMTATLEHEEITKSPQVDHAKLTFDARNCYAIRSSMASKSIPKLVFEAAGGKLPSFLYPHRSRKLKSLSLRHVHSGHGTASFQIIGR